MECGCKVNTTSTHRRVSVGANVTSGYIRLLLQWAEQLREDKQELKTREEKKKTKDAKRIRGIVRENKGTSHAKDEMGNSCTTRSRSCSACGWLDPELCAKARREEVEYIRRHKMHTRVPRETCLHETVKAPIKTGWAETDKGQPGMPNVRARWVAKECQTHARPVLYLSTPPLEALKVMLSEVATGKRGGKVVGLVDVRRAYFHAPSRRRVLVELPPEDYQPGDEHMCGLLQCSLYGTRDAAQNWKEKFASALSDLKLTRGIACPCMWQGCLTGEHFVSTLHGKDITIGGNDQQWNSSSKMMSRKYEIKKQVIGEDASCHQVGSRRYHDRGGSATRQGY